LIPKTLSRRTKDQRCGRSSQAMCRPPQIPPLMSNVRVNNFRVLFQSGSLGSTIGSDDLLDLLACPASNVGGSNYNTNRLLQAIRLKKVRMWAPPMSSTSGGSIPTNTCLSLQFQSGSTGSATYPDFGGPAEICTSAPMLPDAAYIEAVPRPGSYASAWYNSIGISPGTQNYPVFSWTNKGTTTLCFMELTVDIVFAQGFAVSGAYLPATQTSTLATVSGASGLVSMYMTRFQGVWIPQNWFPYN
jgi:hypothetical protein